MDKVEILQSKIDELEERLAIQKTELEEELTDIKSKIDYCFEDMSENFDSFCDVCHAKGKCNGCCCYDQLKELIYNKNKSEVDNGRTKI